MGLNFQQEGMTNGPHNQRLSQAIMQHGVGAMIDFPDRTLTVAAPETWERFTGRDKPQTIHDTRFEKSLSQNGQHIREFRAPRALNYVEFPYWYFCPKCHSLKPLREWRAWAEELGRPVKDNKGNVYAPQCPQCRKQLVPARLVVACENGHLDDFPWVKWVHYRNEKEPVEPCEHPQLTYEAGSGSETGEDIRVKCSCGAEATLKGAFAADAFTQVNEELGKEIFHCTGYKPERGTHEDNCEKAIRAFPRGASSVYFSFIRTSLVLPPIGNDIRSLVEGSSKFIQYRTTLDTMKSMGMSEEDIAKMTKANLGKWAAEIAEEVDLTTDAVESALQAAFLQDDSEVDVDDIHYRKEEYDALLANPADLNGMDREGTFDKLDERAIAEYEACIPGFDLHLSRVALIDKIGVVRALLGYSRIHPAASRKKDQGFVAVKEAGTSYYPAVQVFGEGIFLELDPKNIEAWLVSSGGQKAVQRVNAWKKRVKAGNAHNEYFNMDRIDAVTPKFLLLHTLSHLLIRELSFHCGYNVASLSERIYCADEDKDGFNMSGIFIYTANGDAEGTMGGLIRQGRPDTLPIILQRALAKGQICSNDPVCIGSAGQGLDGQNLAACHSCALLPETSCEAFNVFLDRGVVVGTFDDPDMGFYQDTGTKIETAMHKAGQAEKSANPARKSSAIEGARDAAAWKNIHEELLEDEAIEAADRLERAGIPAPDKAGAELLDGRCNAELVWLKQKIAYLTSEQMEQADALRRVGWQILDLSQPLDVRMFEKGRTSDG